MGPALSEQLKLSLKGWNWLSFKDFLLNKNGNFGVCHIRTKRDPPVSSLHRNIVFSQNGTFQQNVPKKGIWEANWSDKPGLNTRFAGNACLLVNLRPRNFLTFPACTQQSRNNKTSLMYHLNRLFFAQTANVCCSDILNLLKKNLCQR